MMIQSIRLSSALSFSFIGPPLSKGPLPAVFYFALSAKDSLETDPFNQPARFLASDEIRIFSVTLPEHEEGKKPEKAIDAWAERMRGGDLVLAPFFKEVQDGIESLLHENVIAKEKLGFMGLSRGVFVAAHVAAKLPFVSLLLGFAPLTSLGFAKEFREGPAVADLDLIHLAPKLCDRTLRFYIGNTDTRVGTNQTFDFVLELAKEAKERRIRSAPIELIVGPSIGFQGHGTGPHVFEEGANWIKKRWDL